MTTGAPTKADRSHGFDKSLLDYVKTNIARNNKRKEEIAQFILKNFQIFKCVKYLKGNSDFVADGPDGQIGDPGAWSVASNCKLGPCDAFGELSFDGVNSKFIRVNGVDTEKGDCFDRIYTLLTSENLWQVQKPQLIIDVIGAESLLVNSVGSELVEAAKEAKAWIVANGSSNGVANLADGKITCIGIAPWGGVKGRNVLRNPSGNALLQSAYPPPGDETSLDGVSEAYLGKGHSHYLLVDNALEKPFGNVAAEFQESFLKFLSQTTIEDSATIGGQTPVITLCLGGGPDTFRKIETCVTGCQTKERPPRPVVVMAGHQQDVAEVFAYAYSLTKSEMATVDIKNQRHQSIVNSRSTNRLSGLENNFPADFDLKLAKHPSFTALFQPTDSDSAKEALKSIRNCLADRKWVSVIDKSKNRDEKLSKFVVGAIYKAGLAYTFTEQDNTRDKRIAKYVRSTFKLRRCKRHVTADVKADFQIIKSVWQQGDCVCGRSHKTSEQQQSSEAEPPWSFDADTEPYPCDTFGRLYYECGEGIDPMSIAPGASSHYIRLPGHIGDPFYMDRVYTLMMDERLMGMPKPQLIIEVTGAAAKLPDVKRGAVEKFNKGLQQAAKKANAWLVTGGTNGGVMQLVGEAVAKSQVVSLNRPIVCLGVCSWGIIAGRDQLISPKRRNPTNNEEVCTGNWRAKYLVKQTKSGEYSCLNPGHNYYIFVDNGRDKRFGEEIDFRAHLLDYLSRKTLDSGGDIGRRSRIPLVLLVVGGGPNSLKTVEVSLKEIQAGPGVQEKRPRPVILLSGFGGAADLLTYAFEITAPKPNGGSNSKVGTKALKVSNETEFPDNFDQLIKEHSSVDRLFPPSNSQREKLINEGIATIRNCLKTRNLITVVNIFDEKKGHRLTLDQAILNAIFRSNFGSPASTLEIAQLWRLDHVARRILEDSAMVEMVKTDGNCSGMMTRAIEKGQLKFYDLLLEYRVLNFAEYLTLDKIEKFYKDVFIHQTIKTAKSCVKLFRSLLFKEEGLDALQNERKEGLVLETVGEILAGLLHCYLQNVFEPELKARKKHVTLTIPESELFKRRLRDLFLFQLVLGRSSFAVHIWKDINFADKLGAALMATVLLHQLSQAAYRLDMQDLSDSYQEISEEWRSRTVRMLAKCYEKRPEFTNRLLTRALKTWQERSLLEMAYYGNQKLFMEQSAVQTKISLVWHGRIAPFTSTTLIYSIALLPILWPFINQIPFYERTEIAEMTIERKKESQPMVDNKKSKVHPIENSKERFQNGDIEKGQPQTQTLPEEASETFEHDDNNDEKVMTGSERQLLEPRLFWFIKRRKGTMPAPLALFYLYTSPMVRYLIHSLSTFAYLLLFAYFVLVSVRVNVSLAEILLWAWSFCILLETIHETLSRESLTFSQFISAYLTNLSGWLDFSALIVLLVAAILRYFLEEDQLFYPQTLYAISCLFFWVKSLRIFYVTKLLGPKVITLFNMMQDLVFFVVIYFVLLFAFSIPIYALTHPNLDVGDTSDFLALILRIIYTRWWNIVGVGLDTSRADVEGRCPSSQPSDNASADNATSIMALLMANNVSNASSSAPAAQWTCPKREYEADDFTQRNVVAILMLVVYFILTNITLLNMLIAMFSHTVDETRTSAVQLWRFSFYRMVSYFYVKPYLPPPLNVLELCFYFIRFLRNLHKGSPKQNSELKEYFKLDNDFHYWQYNQLEAVESNAVATMDDDDKDKANGSRDQTAGDSFAEDLLAQW